MYLKCGRTLRLTRYQPGSPSTSLTTIRAARNGRRFLAMDATFRAIHTTRERLIRAGSAPFALHTSDTGVIKAQDGNHFDFQLAPQQIQLIGTENPAFWEVDPCWNGKVFRSAAQAVLPLRSGAIETCLPLPEKSSSDTLCVRVVTAQGEQLIIPLQK